MTLHDADFYRRHVRTAYREVAAAELSEDAREVVRSALDLLGILITRPDATWRPWHDYQESTTHEEATSPSAPQAGQ